MQCLPVLTGLDPNSRLKEDKTRANKGRYGNRRNHDTNSFSTRAKEGPPRHKEGKERACHWCKAPHDLHSCQEFMKRPMKERTQFIIKKGLCLRCLRHGHMAKENKCSNVPSCVKCNQKHPTCLHNDTSDSAQRTDEVEEHTDNAAANCIGVCSIEGQQLGEDQSLIIPVWVSSSNHPQNESLTYALIDCQSNATFITEKLRQTLNVDSVDSHLLLSTMHKENEIVECKNVKGLIATDLK